MAVSLTHTTVAVGVDAGNGEIHKAQWNENHTLTAAINNLLGTTALSTTVTEIPCTAAGRTIIAAVDAAAQRTALGLGTSDSPTFGSVLTLASSATYTPQIFLANSSADTSGPYWLTRKLRGTAAATAGDSLGTFAFQSADTGGTTRNSTFFGSASAGAGATWHAGYLYFTTTNTSGVTSEKMRIDSSGAIGFAGANFGTSGQPLLSGGSSASPTWGTLSVSGGGTGATTLTGLVKGNGTSAMTAAVAGTDYLAPSAIGTTVQAYDADLAAIAALSPALDNFIVGNGTSWIVESGATARTSLGLGTGNSPQFTAIELGAASDTTISRVSAGVIAVEGGTVALENRQNNFNSGQVVGGGTGFAGLYLNGAAGAARSFVFQSGGVNRWTIQANNNTESGSNAGSAFDIIRCTDAGTNNGTPFSINRSTGVITLESLAGTGSRTVTAGAAGALSASSDSRLKQEVFGENLPGLSEVLQIRPHAYKWLEDIANRGDEASVEVGFFANEVAPVIPSAAPMGNDGYYGFNDRAVIAALVNAVQQLNEKIESLEARLAAVEAV